MSFSTRVESGTFCIFGKQLRQNVSGVNVQACCDGRYRLTRIDTPLELHTAHTKMETVVIQTNLEVETVLRVKRVAALAAKSGRENLDSEAAVLRECAKVALPLLEREILGEQFVADPSVK